MIFSSISYLALVLMLIKPVLSEQKGCVNTLQWINTNINVTSSDESLGRIAVAGYKCVSGSSSLTVIGTGTPGFSVVECSASFACNGINSIKAYQISCYGSYSCSNISNIKGYMITASGANSLSNSHIFNSTDLRCEGDQSCAYAHITSAKDIYAQGSYSLFNAVINASNHTTPINIHLSAHYAGYGAIITCPQSSECNIYCGSNACYMLRCRGNCTIHNTSTDAIYPLTDLDPLNIINNYTNIFSYYPETTVSTNDILCSMQPNNMRFDNSAEHWMYTKETIPHNNTGGSVCCRGHNSCLVAAEPVSDVYLSTFNDSIICSGGYSCTGTYVKSINTLGAVFCEGSYSCYSYPLKSIHAQTLYCMGYRACDSAQITSISNVYCSGAYSCQSLNISSFGTDLDLYLLGQTSGRYSEVHCFSSDRCFIFCSGYLSCDSMYLYCDGICNVECNDYTDCPIGWTFPPTMHPTQIPTVETLNPTLNPTLEPTTNPTMNPSFEPVSYICDEIVVEISNFYVDTLSHDDLIQIIVNNTRFSIINAIRDISTSSIAVTYEDNAEDIAVIHTVCVIDEEQSQALLIAVMNATNLITEYIRSKLIQIPGVTADDILIVLEINDDSGKVAAPSAISTTSTIIDGGIKTKTALNITVTVIVSVVAFLVLTALIIFIVYLFQNRTSKQDNNDRKNQEYKVDNKKEPGANVEIAAIAKYKKEIKSDISHIDGNVIQEINQTNIGYTDQDVVKQINETDIGNNNEELVQEINQTYIGNVDDDIVPEINQTNMGNIEGYVAHELVDQN